MQNEKKKFKFNKSFSLLAQKKKKNSPKEAN